MKEPNKRSIMIVAILAVALTGCMVGDETEVLAQEGRLKPPSDGEVGCLSTADIS
jgi:hypothetical protein